MQLYVLQRNRRATTEAPLRYSKISRQLVNTTKYFTRAHLLSHPSPLQFTFLLGISNAHEVIAQRGERQIAGASCHAGPARAAI